ncbi:MAG: hypothetical protein GXO74_06145 [Calditrichaeota bacterium]|nr:hypothetical protein [Calditrichota bacterium]
MPRRRNRAQSDLFNIRERLSTAPCVLAIRNAVEAWREGGHRGVTKTTKELLNYWFFTDHKQPNGSVFRYYVSQREAIETLIYVYEIKKIRSRKQLLEKFAYSGADLRLPPHDDFARFCVKMATGSKSDDSIPLAIGFKALTFES